MGWSPRPLAAHLLELAVPGRLHGRQQRGAQRLEAADGAGFEASGADLSTEVEQV